MALGVGLEGLLPVWGLGSEQEGKLRSSRLIENDTVVRIGFHSILQY